MSNIIEKAELVDVTDKDGKINLTFLKDDKIYEVGWNKRAYDSTLNDFVENKEKEEKVEEWSQNYFGVPTKDLTKKLGSKQDIYVYDTYASLWQSYSKFTNEDVGQQFRTTIDKVEVTDNGILIVFEWKEKGGQLYSSKMGFKQKLGDGYYTNPIKERKQRQAFQDKYGVPVEESDKVLGQEILVKVKKAFGKYPYSEITVL